MWKCDVLVHDGDKALFCEICNLWYHIKCPNITAAIYGVLQKSPGVHWYCEGCDKGVSKLLQTLAQMHQRLDKLEKELTVIRKDMESI